MRTVGEIALSISTTSTLEATQTEIAGTRASAIRTACAMAPSRRQPAPYPEPICKHTERFSTSTWIRRC